MGLRIADIIRRGLLPSKEPPFQLEIDASNHSFSGNLAPMRKILADGIEEDLMSRKGNHVDQEGLFCESYMYLFLHDAVAAANEKSNNDCLSLMAAKSSREPINLATVQADFDAAQGKVAACHAFLSVLKSWEDDKFAHSYLTTGSKCVSENLDTITTVALALQVPFTCNAEINGLCFYDILVRMYVAMLSQDVTSESHAHYFDNFEILCLLRFLRKKYESNFILRIWNRKSELVEKKYATRNGKQMTRIVQEFGNVIELIPGTIYGRDYSETDKFVGDPIPIDIVKQGNHYNCLADYVPENFQQSQLRTLAEVPFITEAEAQSLWPNIISKGIISKESKKTTPQEQDSEQVRKTRKKVDK